MGGRTATPESNSSMARSSHDDNATSAPAWDGRLALSGGGGCRCRQAEDGEAAGDEELGDLVQLEVAAGAVPVPDAVVQAEHGAREQPGVCLRDGTLGHGTGEEGGPGEFEVAGPRAGALARLF